MNEQGLTEALALIDTKVQLGHITEEQARGYRWMARVEAGAELTDEQFDKLVAEFVALVQETQQAHTRKQYPNATLPTFEIMKGPRYVRVVQNVSSGLATRLLLHRSEVGFHLEVRRVEEPGEGTTRNDPRSAGVRDDDLERRALRALTA